MKYIDVQLGNANDDILDLQYLENFWVAWTCADPGTHADETSWTRRIAAIVRILWLCLQ